MTDTLDLPITVRSRTIESLTEKIAKLLNQAEHAGTEAEAAVFMAKAQELATLHSIDLAKARHATIAKQRTTPVSRTITLGVKGSRGLNTLVELFNGIASANDITLNVAHNSTYVIGFGFAEDLDVAESLYASLSVQMAQAVSAYRASGQWRNEEVYRPGRIVGRGWDQRWIDGEIKPITWLSARLDFQEGFARRIGSRLRDAQREAQAKAKADDMAAAADAAAAIDSESTGTAMVLVEKREAIAAFYNKASRARGAYRGGRRVASSGAVAAGSAAGDRARLSASTSLAGARKALR